MRRDNEAGVEGNEVESLSCYEYPQEENCFILALYLSG
jgi:hypothetical protein